MDYKFKVWIDDNYYYEDKNNPIYSIFHSK